MFFVFIYIASQNIRFVHNKDACRTCTITLYHHRMLLCVSGKREITTLTLKNSAEKLRRNKFRTLF